MASTNKTTNYELSQYIGTDKPTYLVDYNTDMSRIDTGIHNAQTKANTNENAIGILSSLTTTTKTTLVDAINEVDAEADTNTSNIGNISNLTTSVNNDLVVAINEVDAHTDNNTDNIGILANLETTLKTNLVGAINEVLGKLTKVNTYTKLYDNPTLVRNTTIQLSENYSNYNEIYVEIDQYNLLQNITAISDEISPNNTYIIDFSSSSQDRRIGIKFQNDNEVAIDFDDAGVSVIKAVYGINKK